MIYGSNSDQTETLWCDAAQAYKYPIKVNGVSFIESKVYEALSNVAVVEVRFSCRVNSTECVSIKTVTQHMNMLSFNLD